MNLFPRLAATMVVLVLLTATAVGLLTYRNLEEAILPRALDRVEGHTRHLASEFESFARTPSADVLGYRASVALNGIIRARLAGGFDSLDGTSEATWRERLAARFSAELASKLAYSQLRIIGVDNNGRELVRVDRSGPDGAVRTIPDSELQAESDREYFIKTIGLPAGTVYVSPIDLNQERGAIEIPHVPTMRVSTSIHEPGGRLFGIVVVNVDMRPIFERLRMLARVGGGLYVANEQGDYLLHPDPDREFGFEFGKRFRWQNDFPEIAAEVGSEDAATLVMRDDSGKRGGAALVMIQVAAGPIIAVIETVPNALIMASADAVQQSSIMAGSIAVLVAALLAILLARSLTKPLVLMRRAVEGFTGDMPVPMPEDAKGEIGVLARAFTRMTKEMRDKTAALKTEIIQSRRIFETSLDLIVVLDHEGTFLQVSPSSQINLGYDPEDFVGRSAAEFVFREDLDRMQDEMLALRTGLNMRSLEIRFLHKEGRVVSLEWTGVWSDQQQQYFLTGRNMTERLLAEEKFRLAVEASPSGVIIVDAEGKIVLVNAETERLFGYERQELIGQPVEVLVPSSARGQHDEYRMGFAKNPNARRMGAGRDLYGVRKDGSEFPVEIGLNPIQTRQGLLILSMVVDITERKAAEQAIRQYAEREQLVIAAVESSDDAIITKTLEGIITGWNHSAERLFGFSAQEAIGKSIDIIVPNDRQPEVRALLEKIRTGEHVGHHETVRINKNGQYIDISLSMSPIKSAAGVIIGAAKVARDVTEHKQVQEAFLREFKERQRLFYILSNTINGMVDAVLVADVNGKIILCNPASERLMGVTSELEPSEWFKPGEVLASDGTELSFSERPLMRAVRGELVENCEITIRRGAERKSYHLIANGGPILDALNQNRGAVVVYRDITENLEIERQLRQAQKMEAVGELTGGIAHDFNNILTVITGTIEILADAVADKPALASIAKMIDEAAGRGADLTQRLLAFARRQPLQPRETDINSLIVETAKLLRPTLGEHIEIESILPDSLQAALVDPNQLTTALINLALNARDAMPNGGKLMFETENADLDEAYAGSNTDVQPGSYVMIAVSDTGSGIPSEIRDRVFEPFFTTKEVGRGSGLGLSMVYGFIKQSEGHININSEEGHGTTVNLYLPRSRNPVRLAEEEVMPAVETGSEIILVVEDDDLVRNYVVTQLSSFGYEVRTARNAVEALAIIERGAELDLLFTDVIMPGPMNGRRLSEAALKLRPSLKVLFTSGYTENAIVHRGRLDPGVLLLAKPYRKAELARMIRQALRGNTGSA
jgi:PAS domain S-box-containing protein